MKKPMHQFAKPSTFDNAKHLRYVQTTEAELKLWEAIRNKKLGVKFRQQHPINVFILDFYCHEANLVMNSMSNTIIGFNKKCTTNIALNFKKILDYTN